MHGLEGRGDGDLLGRGELHLVVHVAIDSVRHGGLEYRECDGVGGMCGVKDAAALQQDELVEKVWSLDRQARPAARRGKTMGRAPAFWSNATVCARLLVKLSGAPQVCFPILHRRHHTHPG